ncbi:fibronectin type III domain-containing protein [Chitinophaga sp. HK235]|uniref:fibronectin type III domain-containing protein n=1 Tax=Chitinophaga sp. HK235 TaxID=2952571 RepID=UPI001BA870EA|nr:fibronectin type III domain-containing protein [Chitinophaga sp. HK235]
MFTVKETVVAQQYPVTASTQIIPPYSVYLPDYTVPGSDKLRVILVQNDLTKPSYDVRLQMTVERNGTLIMRTAPAFNPRPLTLNAGVPTIISGTDLADYLNTNNIEFSGGFSRDSYERTRSLPEGSYRITFTAFDYRRPQVQVSNIGANIFFFQKNDPPLLNMPICGSRVEKRDPQFLTFSWSSRNTPNPLDGGGTEYIFSLYEIKPKNSNPDYIVRSTRPIYTITTEQNTIAYGPGEPALTDSMEYVWIVQARDKSGRDMFSNQGLSQSCRFTYLGNNPFETNKIGKPTLSGQATGERTIRLSWQLASDNVNYKVDAYRVQYRAAKKDGVEYDWRTAESPRDTVLNINSLEPGRSYEARLQWLVAGVYGPFSDIVTVTTKPSRTFTCGDPALLQTPQNNTPLPTAIAGSIFRIGHFDVMLTEVTGGDGVFSGRGKVITPGFGTGMLLQFNRISVNTDLVVTRGEMQAVTDGIDKFVNDAVKHQRGGDEVGQVKTGDIVPDITTKLHLFTKESIVVDTDKGTITLKDSNTGKEEVINYKEKGKALPLVIEDTDGNLYNVDKNGKVTSAGTRDKGLAGNPAALAALNTLDLSNGMITFSVKDSKYAFDSWKDSYYGKPVLDSSYEKLADGRYRVSAKAIVPGEQDQVIATLVNAKDIDRSKIKFVSGKGIAYPADSTKDGFIITLTGGPAGDAQEVYAVYTKGGKYISMGKLLVASYAAKQKRVVLVPVGYNTNVSADVISKALKDAYEKIGITYTVETDTSFRANKDWDLNKDAILQDSKSAFLGNGFTGEEKAMRKAYSKTHNIDKDATYLFVVNEAALTDGDLLGKMPRQSQFGFIFIKNATAEKIARTVAHETGHGAFTLEHTFSAGIGLDKGSTDNLMDYNNGYNLLKYQWDVVHDPGHVWGIFEDDKDGQLFSGDYIRVSDYLLKDITDKDYIEDGKIGYVTPDGQIIRLERDVKVSFGGYLEVKATGEKSPLSKEAIGVVTAFYKDNQYWMAYFVSGNFTGYYDAAQKKYDQIETTGTRLVVAGVEFSPCKVVFYAGRYTAQKAKYASFSEIRFVDDEKKMIGVKEVTGDQCINCTLPLEKKPKSIQNVLIELAKDPKSTALDNLVAVVSEDDMKTYICLEDRFSLITNIVNGWRVGDTDEMSIVKLIRSTPDKDAAGLIDMFDKNYDYLLSKLFYSIDGAELDEYFSAMSQLYFRSKSSVEWQKEYDAKDANYAAFHKAYGVRDSYFEYALAREVKIFPSYIYKKEWYGTENLIHYKKPIDAELFAKDGTVSVGFRYAGVSLDHPTFSMRPFELVEIYYNLKEYPDSAMSAYLPAMSLAYIANKYENLDIAILANKLIVTLATKQMLTPGITAGAFLWATVDMVVANGNLYIIQNEEQLAKSESGKKFVKAWEKVNTYVLVAQGARLYYGLAKNYLEYTVALKEMKAAYKEYELTDLKALRETNPELAAKLESFGRDGIRQLDNLEADYALQLQKEADDAAEVGRRSVALGEDVQDVAQWLNKTGDGNVYLVVHGEEGNYYVIHKGTEIPLTHRSLSKWIESQEDLANKRLVLLSCADLETAQHLSRNMGRELVANEGVVTVFENGGIKVEQQFRLLTPKGNASEAPVFNLSTKEGVGKFVQLGKNDKIIITRTVDEAGVTTITKSKGNKSWSVGAYKRGEYLLVKPANNTELFGGNRINVANGRTVTVTGILEDVNLVADAGNRDIAKMQPNYGANPGGINILRSGKWGQIQSDLEYLKEQKGITAYWDAVTEEFWETANKPWIDAAIARGDEFRFVSDPNDMRSLFVRDKVTKQYAYRMNENGAPILENDQKVLVKSIFSREIEYLKANGYRILENRTGAVKIK